MSFYCKSWENRPISCTGGDVFTSRLACLWLRMGRTINFYSIENNCRLFLKVWHPSKDAGRIKRPKNEYVVNKAILKTAVVPFYSLYWVFLRLSWQENNYSFYLFSICLMQRVKLALPGSFVPTFQKLSFQSRLPTGSFNWEDFISYSSWSVIAKLNKTKFRHN